MGVAKEFCMRLAKSSEYEIFENAIIGGKGALISRYHRLISEKIERFQEETYRRINRYGRINHEAEEQFDDALRKQTEIHIPAWYDMGDLPF